MIIKLTNDEYCEILPSKDNSNNCHQIGVLRGGGGNINMILSIESILLMDALLLYIQCKADKDSLKF